MKKHLKIAIAALTMICVSVAAAAQQKISGTVKDAQGPVIGVSVLVEGTSNGTVTDLDGNYSLSVPAGSTIVVSCIGYAEQSVKVTDGQSVYDFVMTEDNEYLDDVVVIGYQTVKRRDLTGSVASVTGKDIATVPVANVAQAMQGKLAGVQVTSQDGRPGATMSIRVRGGGSITQSNEPLYIVDGVIVSNIDDIPADNIESIDILKDAASTAIYGARGANGVVLVTTKGGKEEKVTVRYGMYYQVKENPRTLDVLDAEDYVLWNWSYATAYGESYGDNVAKYFGLGSKYGNNLSKYAGLKSHNYINDIMKSASTWNHDLSLSGGSDQTKYFASVNYLNDDGIRINSGFSRFNANFKLNQKIGKRLEFNADVRYSQMEIVGTQYGLATSAYTFRPVDTPYGDDDPTLFGNCASSTDMAYSPIATINNYDNVTDRYRLRGTAGLTWNAFEGFVAKSEITMNRNWSETDYWNNGQNPSDTAYKLAKLTKGDGQGMRWSTTVNYQVPFANTDHSLNVLAGYEVISSESNSTVIQGAGYPAEFTKEDAFGMINMTDSSLGKDYNTNTIGTPSHTVSYFGRVNYSYKGRYMLTATFRADGSSKFAPNNHWGYFPAAAAAWRISDEPWMNVTKNWMDDLKLRVSYGTSGSDGIDSSLWKETWTTKDVTIDGVLYTSYTPGEMLSNPDLKWETTISRNVGVDFSFWKSRLRGSIEAYCNTTKDILMKVPCDASSGYTYQFQNVGQTSNKGFEIAVSGAIVQRKDWGITASLTYSYNHNNVDAINNNATSDTHTGWGSTMRVPYYDYVIREGEPVGLVQGFKSLGYYTLDDFDYTGGKYVLKQGIADLGNIVNYPDGMKAYVPDGQVAFPGAAKFEDTDGNGVVDINDTQIIGKMMPQHTGGFTLGANWKGFDLSASFTYQIGGMVYNANAMHSMMGNKDNQLGENRLSYVKDCWKAYNTNSAGDLYLVTDPAELAALNTGAKYALPYSEYGICTSDFIEDASYLRLNTLTIGYTIPRKVLDAIKIQNARIYATAGNLFCMSGYSGLDPDVNTNTNAGGDGFPTLFYDYQSYPKSRSYTFGINITF